MSGFTLIELLVTISLMALVAGTCLAVLGGGIKVWKRATAYGTQEQSALVAADRLRRDLENTRHFSLLPFDGRYDRSTFAYVDHGDQDSQNPAELGQLSYFLDEPHHLLCRSFVPYRSLKHVRLNDRCQPVLEGVSSVRFLYFGTKDDGAAGWSQRWHGKTLPSAVKVMLTLGGDAQPSKSYSTVVAVMNTNANTPAQP